jgi:RNA polymerase sigma factor (sigma-70 family)
VELPQVPGDLAADVAERDAVWTVLAELPPRWRAVLLLQTVAGFEVREVASLLQLSEANVRKSLFRAKERFRTLYHSLDGRGDE